MFDIIEDVLFCPFCGEKQEEREFQSKDIGDIGSIWTLKEIIDNFGKREIIEIYNECLKCKNWISLNIIPWRMASFKN